MTYHEEVAGEVRAHAARHQITNSQIGEALAQSPMNTSRRMRGLTPFTLDELPQLAELFGVEISDLLPPSTWGQGRRGVINGRRSSHLRLIPSTSGAAI
jgi:hypothetical protein